MGCRWRCGSRDRCRPFWPACPRPIRAMAVTLLFALAVGVVLEPSARHHLTSRWLWAGVLAAAFLASEEDIERAARRLVEY